MNRGLIGFAVTCSVDARFNGNSIWNGLAMYRPVVGGAARASLTAVVAAFTFAIGCDSSDSMKPQLVPARIKITDAPFPWDSVSAVNPHIVRIDASTSNDSCTRSSNRHTRV